jgi:DnaJ homolog subfamily C member 9
MSINPYEILHLEEDATYDEIKERYRHLTRSLHPDKQPLENYQITKRLFEQIDEAYKSISSPLRRHLFREYGLAALKVLEEVPNYFEEFDVEELSPSQILVLFD